MARELSRISQLKKALTKNKWNEGWLTMGQKIPNGLAGK